MNIRQWQWAWTAVVLVSACLIILFETGLLPMGLFCGDAGLQYALDILTVVLTLGGMVLGMKWKGSPWVRLVCLGLPLVLSLLVYFLFVSPTAPYCAAVTGVAMLLLWPRDNTPEI